MRRLLALSFAALLAACAPGAGSVGGADYNPAYDFHEFYQVTNGRTFHVIVDGNPFPSIAPEEMRRRLLPVMQANRPRPRLTFTYDAPAERQRPDYRLVLVFDAALDLTAARVCANEVRHRPNRNGTVSVFGVYCRNDAALSQSVASTPASSPEDPRMGQILQSLFLVLFTDQPPIRQPLPFTFMR
ncbi:MAG: hypothetical protein JSR24_15730 [Proteobacteria bacterium]|nr:hypothetical protein [Pseudomonadota bacterium]